MDWFKTNYDRAFLLIASIVAILLSSFLILRSLGEGGGEAPTAPNERDELTPSLEVMDEPIKVAASLDEPQKWDPPKKGNKVITLFASVPVLAQSGKIYDVYDQFTRSYGNTEVPGWWMWQNEIDVTNSTALNDDDDGDGFTNGDEFEGGSDPQDATKMPEFYKKLKLVERVAEDYSLRLAGVAGGTLTVRRDEPRLTRYLEVGKTFDKRFKLLKVEAEDYNGIPKNVLYVEDLVRPDGNPVKLPQGIPVNRPIYKGKISYSPDSFETTVGVGEEFKIPSRPEISIRLDQVEEDSAVISYLDEKTSKRVERTLGK